MCRNDCKNASDMSGEKVAYATFSVLQIFHSGEAYLVEFDNPSVCLSVMGRL